MSDIERKRGDLQPVDWRQAKQAMRERFNAEVRVETGARITKRAIQAKHDIQGEVEDGLDLMLLQSFVFGAGEIIEDYMNRR